MLELKELKEKYIEYSEEITEDIFNKILDRAKEFAKKICPNLRTYGSFDDNSFNSFRLNKFFRFSGENYSYGVDNNSQSANEIKVSDILGEEAKFEVGKWYSFYWDWGSGYDIVAKVFELGVHVRFNNFISITRGGYLDQSFNSIRLAEIKNIKELTLEKIQQHLPDGHPDKIAKEFVLPEKWYIKMTEENQKVVGAWLMKNDYQPNINDLDKGRYTDWYFKYPRGSDCSGSQKKPSKDYIEITFEQFKRYALKGHKPLTVDNLVEGEVYFAECGKEEWNSLFYCKNPPRFTVRLYISNKHTGKKYDPGNWGFTENNNYRVATPEEKHWLLTCIKQDKFVPKEDLSKYDSEGNLIEMKEYVNTATEEQFLFVIAKLPYKSTGWTWRGKETCINLQRESYSHPRVFEANNYYTFQEWLDLNGYVFTGRIANKFNIGDEVQVCLPEEDTKSSGYLNINNNRLEKIGGVSSIEGEIKSFKDHGGMTYYKLDSLSQGLISEDCLKLVKSCVAPKESKEMQLSDLKNPVFNVGDKVRVIADSLREFNNFWASGNNTDFKKNYEGIITKINSYKSAFKEVYIWCELDYSGESISCNLLELVEPAKSSEAKVDRNVYYEASNQEQYEEILDWLEGMGEEVDKGFGVTIAWKYVVFNLSIQNSWALSDTKLNLPKAGFQFKNKQKCEVCEGKGGWTRDGFCDPCPECDGEGYIENDIIKPPIPPTKQIPEIEAVTNRFKASPIRKRSLPEIY